MLYLGNEMKKLLILTLLILGGCAHTRTTPSTTVWLDSFRPSGSFCLDAYSVNSAAAGCTGWSSRIIPGSVMEIRCTTHTESEERSPEESIWLESTFVFWGNGTPAPPLRHQPICSDVNGIFSVLIAD